MSQRRPVLTTPIADSLIMDREDFLAARAGKEKAAQHIDALLDELVEALSNAPLGYPISREVAEHTGLTEFREYVTQDGYRVFCQVLNDAVVVHLVIHERQDARKVLIDYCTYLAHDPFLNN